MSEPNRPMMNILHFMQMQDDLQSAMKEANPQNSGSPYDMTPQQLAEFITWNHTALVVELSEMLGEVGWKPWASSRHVNHPAAMKEMVDAWHFFLNILNALAAMADLSMWEMARQFDLYYQEKNAKNLQRQVDGYDGITGKCPWCKRELSDADPLKRWTDGPLNLEFCSEDCCNLYHNNKENTQ